MNVRALPRALAAVLVAAWFGLVPATPPLRSGVASELPRTRLARGPVDFTSPDVDAYPVLEPAAHFRLVELRAEKADGSVSRIRLVRPLPWFTLGRVVVGGTIPLDLPAMGIRGPARVVAVRPFAGAARSQPNLRTVTGTFEHRSEQVFRLSVAGRSAPLSVTGSHPFFRCEGEGGAWTAARALRPGDLLRTAHGTTRVVDLERVPGAHTVFNLEVHREHTYFVASGATDDALWVHNDCQDFITRRGLYDPVPLTRAERRRARAWQDFRLRLMRAWRDKTHPEVSERTRHILWGSGDEAINTHMTPDDCAAVIKERRGVRIPNPNTGGFYNHIHEATNAMQAVRKQLTRAKRHLDYLYRRGLHATKDAGLVRAKIVDLRDTLRMYRRISGDER